MCPPQCYQSRGANTSLGSPMLSPPASIALGTPRSLTGGGSLMDPLNPPQLRGSPWSSMNALAGYWGGRNGGPGTMGSRGHLDLVLWGDMRGPIALGWHQGARHHWEWVTQWDLALWGGTKGPGIVGWHWGTWHHGEWVTRGDPAPWGGTRGPSTVGHMSQQGGSWPLPVLGCHWDRGTPQPSLVTR